MRSILLSAIKKRRKVADVLTIPKLRTLTSHFSLSFLELVNLKKKPQTKLTDAVESRLLSEIR